MAKYRRTYLCICEGQQETMYFSHLAKLIKDFPNKVVKFNTYEDLPLRLEKRYENYDSAAIFDYDHNDAEFKKNIEFCDKLNKKLKPTIRKEGRCVYHAYSNVNFDLWLILHKEDFNGMVSKNDSYITDLKKVYGLKPTDNIKNEEVINKILNQITLDDVKAAIERADNIRRRKANADCILFGNTKTYSNPDFSIHEFLKAVLQDSGDLD